MANYYEWPPKRIRDMEYIYPCKTLGKCGQNAYEARGGTGWDALNAPKNGVTQVTTIAEKYDIPQWRGSYKCCTLCHLPLNLAEAEKANRLLDNKLEDVKIDDDFMELLNGF